MEETYLFRCLEGRLTLYRPATRHALEGAQDAGSNPFNGLRVWMT